MMMALQVAAFLRDVQIKPDFLCKEFHDPMIGEPFCVSGVTIIPAGIPTSWIPCHLTRNLTCGVITLTL